MKKIRMCLVMIVAAVLLHADMGAAQLRVMTLEGPQAVVFSPDGKWIAAALVDGTLKQWETDTGTLVRSIAAHEKYAYALAISRDGRYLVTGGGDKLVKIWNASTAESVRTLSGHTSSVRAVAISPDGTLIAGGDDDGVVKVWEAESGREIYSKKSPVSFGGVDALAFNAAGAVLASGEQGIIRLFDARTGEVVETRKGLIASINGLSFSPDGTRLAAAIYSGSILVADSLSGLNPKTINHGSSAAAVSFNPDGTLIASAGGSGEVRLWDAKTLKAQRTRMRHKEPVFSVAFSPDGRLIASASNDKTLKVWDVATGKEVRSISVP